METPIEQALRDLIASNVIDIGEEEFFEQWLAPLLTWHEDFQPIDDKYMQIVLNAQQLEEYRQAKKDVQSGVIGGGFGVEGAAAGIAVKLWLTRLLES